MDPDEVSAHLKLHLSERTIQEIADLTSGQRDNSAWHWLRSKVLTASHFGRALRASITRDPRIRRRFIESLDCKMEHLADTIPALKWGCDHEAAAIDQYSRQSGRSVEQTGLWLFPNRLLGASPDGLIFRKQIGSNKSIEGIVEVKCPYSCRDLEWGQVLALGKRPAFLSDDDALQINDKHDYYHQIQGQLFATNAAWCDLITWSPYFMKVTRVMPDAAWAANELTRLYSFCKKYLQDRAVGWKEARASEGMPCTALF